MPDCVRVCVCVCVSMCVHKIKFPRRNSGLLKELRYAYESFKASRAKYKDTQIYS